DVKQRGSLRSGTNVLARRDVAQYGLDIPDNVGGYATEDVSFFDLLKLRVRANQAYDEGNHSLGDALENLRDDILDAFHESGEQSYSLTLVTPNTKRTTATKIRAHELTHEADFRAGGLSEAEKQRVFNSASWVEL